MEEHLKKLLVEIQDFRNEANRRFDRLEKGQEELKEAFRHNATFRQNFTDIRKDLRIKIQDTQADVNLPFKEVEEVKRKANKIEQRFKN